MRHDVKYTQSHSAPIRQRPGSMGDLNEHNNYRYHHGNHYRSNGINGYSVSNIDEHGGTVSALSGSESHESQKQWDWLEDVLAKSSRNKETVCCQIKYKFHHSRRRRFINPASRLFQYLDNICLFVLASKLNCIFVI